MEKFIIEVNRTLTFQSMNHEMNYRPDDPYIRTVVIGIRPQSSEDDWIAYIECRLWNIVSQKENTFWNYAREYEKEQKEKPFSGVCNYLKLKNGSKKALFNSMSGWAVYVSELSVYDDVLEKYYMVDYKNMRTEILNAIPAILQHSFLVNPSYMFICDKVQDTETLKAAEFLKIATINAGAITLYMKICK